MNVQVPIQSNSIAIRRKSITNNLNNELLIELLNFTGSSKFSSNLLENHQSSLEQLVHRDRNHPSVIMWSIANEPSADNIKASTYFGYDCDILSH